MEVSNKESNEVEEEVKLMYNPHELSNINTSITNKNHNNDWDRNYHKHNIESNNNNQNIISSGKNINSNFTFNNEEYEEMEEELEEREANLSNTIAMSIRLNVNDENVLDDREEENKLCTPAGQLLHTSHTPFAVTPPCALPVKKYESHNVPFPTSSTVLTFNNKNSGNHCPNSTLQITNVNTEQEIKAECLTGNCNNDNIIDSERENECISRKLKITELESRGKGANHVISKHTNNEKCEVCVDGEHRQLEQVTIPCNINEMGDNVCESSKELSTLSPLSFKRKSITRESTADKNCNKSLHSDDVSVMMRYKPLTGSTIAPEKVEHLDVETGTWLTNSKSKRVQQTEYTIQEEEQEEEQEKPSLQYEKLLQLRTSQKLRTRQIYANSNKAGVKYRNGDQLCKWDEYKTGCNDNDNTSAINMTMANKKQKNEIMSRFTVPQTPIKKPRTMHNSQHSKILPTSLLVESNTLLPSSSTSSTLLTSSQLWANKINSTFATGKLAASLPFHSAKPLIASSARNKAAELLTERSELPLTSAREATSHKLAYRQGSFAPAHFTPNNFVSTSNSSSFSKNHTNGSITSKSNNNYNNYIKGAPTVSRKRPSISISSQLDTMHLWESQTSHGVNNSQQHNNNSGSNNCNEENVHGVSNQQSLPSLQDTRRSIFTNESTSSQVHKPLCTPDDSKTNYFEHVLEQQQKQEREKMYKQQSKANGNVQRESWSHSREVSIRSSKQCKEEEIASNECNGLPTHTPFFTPRILRDYNEVKMLGSGAFGSVGLYEEVETGKLVAIKYSSALISDYIRKQWIREKVIMQHLRNFPHTLQLLSSWEELESNELESYPHSHHYYSGYGNENYNIPEENSVSQTLHGYARNAPVMYLVLEYCPQGSVAARAEIKRQSNSYWSESDLLLFLSHSAIALHALHSHNFAHVDFKPDNVLITDDGEYKLSDFGCSVLLDENEQPRTHLIVKKRKKRKFESVQQQQHQQKKNCKSNNNKSEIGSQPLPLTALDNKKEEHAIKWEAKTQNGEDEEEQEEEQEEQRQDVKSYSPPPLLPLRTQQMHSVTHAWQEESNNDKSNGDDEEEEAESEQIELNVNSPVRFNWNYYCTSPSSQSSGTPSHTFGYTSTSASLQPPPLLSFPSQKVESTSEQEQQQTPLTASSQQTRKECHHATNGVLTCNEQLSLTFEYNNNTQMSLASVDEGDCRYLCSDMLNTKQYFKAGDIFSLGMSMYELMCNEPLPCNGELFLNLRRELPIELLRKSGRYSERLLSLVVQMTTDNPCHRPTAEQVLTFLQPPPAALPIILSSEQSMQQCTLNNSNKNTSILLSNTNVNMKGCSDETNANLCNYNNNNDITICSECPKEQIPQLLSEEYKQSLVSLKACLDASSYLVTHTLRTIGTTNNSYYNINSCNRSPAVNNKETSALEDTKLTEVSVNEPERYFDSDKCNKDNTNNNKKMSSAKHLSYTDGNEHVEQKKYNASDLRVELLPTTQQASLFASRVCTPMTITSKSE